MPTSKYPATQVLDQAAHENIMICIGRLQEASKAATDGLRVLNEDIRTNGEVASAAQHAATDVQKIVNELDRIVRTGNGESLTMRVRLFDEMVKIMRQDLTELSSMLKELRKDIDAMKTQHATYNTGKAAITLFAAIVAWIIATGLAVYGIVKEK